MKQLAASIVVIFALGLALGSFVSGSGDEPELPELEGVALETAALVDCGEGREALLEPVRLDGRTSYKVRCVPAESVRHARVPAIVPSLVVPTKTTASPSVQAPPIAPETPDPTRTPKNDPNKDEGRSWKESAVIIGGAAGAGAGIGAIAKGKKGAAVGAAIGAATGAPYELMKKDKPDKTN